ncbi:hypothetical protein AAVH_39321, partial [Aphelenchoides avenae]
MNGGLADASMHSVFRTLVGVVTTADVIMQFYVIFLVFRVASTTLKEYRYFMLLCSVWDVTFAAWVGYFLRLRPLAPKAPCAVVEGFLSTLGHDGVRVALPLMYLFGAALIGSQSYCVLYRVVLVLDNPRFKPRLLRIQCVGLEAVLILVLSTAVAVGMYITTVPAVYRADGSVHWPDAIDTTNTDSNVLRRAALLTDVDIAVFCVRVDSLALRISLAIIALFAAVEVGSVATGVWIIRKVRQHAAYSPKTKEMHLQLTRLLIAQ